MLVILTKIITSSSSFLWIYSHNWATKLIEALALRRQGQRHRANSQPWYLASTATPPSHPAALKIVFVVMDVNAFIRWSMINDLISFIRWNRTWRPCQWISDFLKSMIFHGCSQWSKIPRSRRRSSRTWIWLWMGFLAWVAYGWSDDLYTLSWLRLCIRSPDPGSAASGMATRQVWHRHIPEGNQAIWLRLSTSQSAFRSSE